MSGLSVCAGLLAREGGSRVDVIDGNRPASCVGGCVPRFGLADSLPSQRPKGGAWCHGLRCERASVPCSNGDACMGVVVCLLGTTPRLDAHECRWGPFCRRCCPPQEIHDASSS